MIKPFMGGVFIVLILLCNFFTFPLNLCAAESEPLRTGYFHGVRVSMLYKTLVYGYFNKKDIDIIFFRWPQASRVI